jgi:hypothetical protein
MARAEREFLEIVLRNPKIGAILDRAEDLHLLDWWLTGGAVFQTVWNVLDGRPAQTGILDYDLFYFDDMDRTAESGSEANVAAAALFADLQITVEVRNEARVHLWYEAEFGVPGRQFVSSCDAIDHFAAITCCYGVTRNADQGLVVYAPHGFDDLLQRRIRANPVLVPREVYESKASRWSTEWPSLTVEPLTPCGD